MNKILRRFVSFFLKPDRPLTFTAFRMVFVARVLKHWPDVNREMAERLLDDYLPEKFGHPGYDWTKAAAIELADICVTEQSE
ncbi:MAG: hypothetical protein JWM58_574 [Rhizobium sp.]|nr:hypothetical protein [Rhizobium sp.]